MTVLGFALVLSAAVCHATWNYFVKRINAGPELIWLFSALSALIYLPFAAYILIGWTGVGMAQIVFILGSVVIHLGYFLLLQAGYRKGDLSLVYPTARATGPLLSTSFAVMFLGEHVTFQIVASGALIVFGVLMLTGFGKRSSGNTFLSLLFGLSAGVLIGGYTAWDAYTVSVLLVPPLLLDYASSVGRTILLAPVAYRRRAQVRDIWRNYRVEVLVIAVLNSLAYMLVLFALTFTPVVYVAPIREVSVLLSVLMGSVLLGEGHMKHRLLWAAVILVGVVALATSK